MKDILIILNLDTNSANLNKIVLDISDVCILYTYRMSYQLKILFLFLNQKIQSFLLH